MRRAAAAGQGAAVPDLHPLKTDAGIKTSASLRPAAAGRNPTLIRLDEGPHAAMSSSCRPSETDLTQLRRARVIITSR
jgi:hypothetical protein